MAMPSADWKKMLACCFFRRNEPGLSTTIDCRKPSISAASGCTGPSACDLRRRVHGLGSFPSFASFARYAQNQSMIRKSVKRFSSRQTRSVCAQIMPKHNLKRDDDSFQSHRALEGRVLMKEISALTANRKSSDPERALVRGPVTHRTVPLPRVLASG